MTFIHAWRINQLKAKRADIVRRTTISVDRIDQEIERLERYGSVVTERRVEQDEGVAA